MIVDLDSHLREGYFLDEVYKLDGALASFTPKKAGDGRSHATRFVHSLEPGDAAAVAAFKHSYIYDPKNDPELADRRKLVALLRPERIGVELSEELQLHPEQSTDALVVHHPEAKYFNAR